LQPKNVISLKFREQFPNLLPILKEFSRFVSSGSYQSIDDEYRKLPLHRELPDDSLQIDIFYNHILNIKNEGGEYLFKHLATFVLNILCLPHSNAECERVFSKINLIKTNSRNRLLIETVSGTVLASQHLKNNGTCKKCIPSQKMLELFNTSMYSKI
jgi:hypothetical protein